MTDSDQSLGFLDNMGRPVEKMPGVIRPATNAIIFNGRREVLMEKRSDVGRWGLPGGGVEIGESIQEGVVREVFEETGLRVEVKRLVGLYSDPRLYSIMSYPGGDVVQYVTAAFECERRSGELRLSEESTDLRYFPAKALPENSVLSHRLRIEDALADLVEPFIR